MTNTNFKLQLLYSNSTGVSMRLKGMSYYSDFYVVLSKYLYVLPINNVDWLLQQLRFSFLFTMRSNALITFSEFG